MTSRWTTAARQWIRWLLGESQLPGRGQRAAAIPIIVVAALAVSGISAGLATTVTSTVPAANSQEADPPTPPPGSLDPIVAATADTSSSSSASDSSPTTTTPASTPTSAQSARVRATRVKTSLPVKAPRVPKVGRHAKGAAGTTPTPTTTPTPSTTTTTTTAPDTGGWA